MKKIWAALAEKGKIASIIGFITSFPVNVFAVIEYVAMGKVRTIDEMYGLIVINVIGWIWFILPSSITFRGGKFELEVKD